MPQRTNLSLGSSRAALFYLVGVALLTVYGSEVCPYLAGLRPGTLFTILGGAFLLAFGLRTLVIMGLRRFRRERGSELEWPFQVLVVDLAAWVVAGLLVTAWNSYRYGFVVGSGLKVVLGCLTLAVFSASYLALDCERSLIQELSRERPSEAFPPGRFMSITTKFLIFLALAIVLIGSVVVLVLVKDSRFDRFEFNTVVREILFVFGVLFAGCFLVGRRFAANLKLIFRLQFGVFERVGEGKFDELVPVVSNDEFSLIARHTNGMIAGLREREEIRDTFGKYVSPTIVKDILKSEKGAQLGGREAVVAVLFTDIRGYTPISERLSPRDLVSLLNEYFALVVGAVHGHDGVLDKFIGDAALAVFGLDGTPHRRDSAVRAGLEIVAGMPPFNERLKQKGLPPIGTGIGIDYGPVVVGNIGSVQRLEYTVIGNTVNTASRLETLTRTLDSTIAVSQSVYFGLSHEVQDQLCLLGSFPLKGKTDAMSVYGRTIG